MLSSDLLGAADSLPLTSTATFNPCTELRDVGVVPSLLKVGELPRLSKGIKRLDIWPLRYWVQPYVWTPCIRERRRQRAFKLGVPICDCGHILGLNEVIKVWPLARQLHHPWSGALSGSRGPAGHSSGTRRGHWPVLRHQPRSRGAGTTR